MVENESKDKVGLALEVFSEERNGRVIFGCYDEEGGVYEYTGPQNVNSLSTLFGRWTGPSPYCDGFPVIIDGTERSSLDTFSMLYTIQCYSFGYHIAEIDDAYVTRIKAALQRGSITITKHANEFFMAMRILRSFERTGHIFDSVNMFGQSDYAAKLAAIPADMRWSENRDMSFPTFQFTDQEKRRIMQCFELNPDADLDDIPTTLRFMESAGITSCYAYIWMSQKYFNMLEGQKAFQYMRDQVRPLNEHVDAIPMWEHSKKNDPFKQLQPQVTLRSLTADLTSSILETLL